MSREEIFFDAITNIREELVEEAQRYVFRKKRAVWRRYAGMAACLVLIAAVCFGVYGLANVRMGGMDAGGMVSTDIGPAAGGANAGGSAEQSTGTASGADENAAPPADYPEDGIAPPESGDSGEGVEEENGSIDTPESSDKEQPVESFVGYILEVREDSLLVDCGGPVEVPLEGLEDLPGFREGDVVHVLCREIISQDGVRTASGIEGVWLLEPEPDAS